MGADPDIRLRSARLVCYRTFDAAEEFDLGRVSAALMDQVVSRASFRTVKPAHLQIPDPPLLVRSGSVTVRAAELTLTGEATIRVFATGILSVGMWLELPPDVQLAHLPAAVAALMDSIEVETHATEMVTRLMAVIGASARGVRTPMRMAEDYAVVLVKDPGPGTTIAQLKSHPAVAAILLGEPGTDPPLAPEMLQSATRTASSYYEDDLVLIDWNAAFVVDPRGGEDVADLLEFATQQLVEFRFYDEHLDRQLERIYDEFEAESKRAPRLFTRPYTQLARQLSLLRVELTEMTEKIDNSLKLVGEPFLARVYLAAVERFRIPQWRVSVEEKLRLVDNLVALVRGEGNTGKSLALESLVVMLILVEIIMGLWRAGAGH